MAIFHCQAKAISRASGRTTTAAAAYRAGVRITDERTGEIHDYTRKQGVLYSQVITPEQGLIIDRKDLWNMAEAAEKRKDAKVAREWEIALPEELDAIKRASLAYRFASYLVERYGVAADITIHAPNAKGDQRNFHAHILTTTRKFDDLELTEKTRILDSPKTSGLEIAAVRQHWAEMVNKALERAGHEARIDHRSLSAQGSSLEPTVHLGPSAAAIERKGQNSRRGAVNKAIQERNGSREELEKDLSQTQKAIVAAKEEKAREAQIEKLSAFIQQAPFADVQKALGQIIKAVEGLEDKKEQKLKRSQIEEIKPVYYARLAKEKEQTRNRAEMPLEATKAQKDREDIAEQEKSPEKPKQHDDRER